MRLEPLESLQQTRVRVGEALPIVVEVGPGITLELTDRVGPGDDLPPRVVAVSPPVAVVKPEVRPGSRGSQLLEGTFGVIADDEGDPMRLQKLHDLLDKPAR